MVMEINKMTWQVEEEHSIYDAVKDWCGSRFICLMKDNTIQIFSGYMDENYDGETNVHVDCISDDNHDDVDDILMWIEVPEKQLKELIKEQIKDE